MDWWTIAAVRNGFCRWVVLYSVVRSVNREEERWRRVAWEGVWFWSLLLYFINKCFSHFLPSLPENKILVAQHPLLIVANQTATLVCNYTYNGTGKEFRASLHKGTDSSIEVCSISWNTTIISKNSNKEFNCQGHHDKNKVIFNLWNMNANQTDIYFCKIEVMYPPPYVYNEKSNGTVIHVKGKLRNLRRPVSSLYTLPPWWLEVVCFLKKKVDFLVKLHTCSGLRKRDLKMMINKNDTLEQGVKLRSMFLISCT